ncbi:MAG: hypothetical protein VX529_06500 [Pseudomonadota bacterium]|nr:hypothetical protein [Pseudomonadota bacterium]
MSEQGFVAISRGLWNDPDFDDGAPMTQREAFIWMVAEAAWKSRKVRRGSAVLEIERGQLAHSVRFMAEAWGWSKSAGHRFLKSLEKRDIIRTEAGTGVTIVTICNYAKYQNAENDTGTEAGHIPGQRRDRGGTNENKDNNYNQKDSLLPADADDWRSDQEFVDLWDRWKATPNGAGRSKTPAKIYPIFCRHRKKAGIARIMAGVTAYFDHDDFKISGGKGLDSWLNDEKYERYADQAKPKIVKPRNHVEELRALGVAI